MIVTLKDIKESIKLKKFKPIYCLHGEEPYNIDLAVHEFENNVMTESEKSFNFTTVYGKEAELKTLMDMAYRYPMMSNYQVVIIKEAQVFSALKKLESYIKKPISSTIFIIVHKYKRIDLRTTFGKLLKSSKDVGLLESNKLFDNQLPKWIENYTKSRGYSLQVGVAEFLAESLGTNLSLIDNEMGKLFENISKNEKITTVLIEKYIGINREYNVFELTDAFSIRNVEKVFKIYNNFAANMKKNPLVPTISVLFNYFSKVYMLFFVPSQKDEMEAARLIGLSPRSPMSASFQIRRYKQGIRNYKKSEIERIISDLKEFDLKSKGLGSVNVPDVSLMKELFARILA